VLGARYPQGGGLTAERQALRERVRMQAAARFADGEDSTAVAKALRVHVRSVQRRWAALQVGGEAALVSKSPSISPSRRRLLELAAPLLDAPLRRPRR